MAFANLRGVLRYAADGQSLVKLVLAAAYSSRPRFRGILTPLLRVLSRDSRLGFRYRYRGCELAASIRLEELVADFQAFIETVVQDCYWIPPEFRPAIVIDGGANLGFFSLGALVRWPDARIVALEPFLENATLLERHLSMNSLAATVLRNGLAARAGSASFYLRDSLRGSLRAEDGPPRKAVQIATRTLSDVYAEFATGPCLVKLDIEGAEIEVLDEFLRMGRSECVIVGELHHWPETGQCFDELFASAGFAVEYYAEDPICKLFTARSPDLAFRRTAPDIAIPA